MIRKETELVGNLYQAIIQKKEQENKLYSLKKTYKHLNLASRNFQGIWSSWWEGGTPPKLEVDMIFVFDDIERLLDGALIIATEVKFFHDANKRNFYEGLQQVLAFTIFGFDGLSLWHLFSEEMDDNEIRSHVGATNEILKGFELPVFYLAAKIADEDKLSFKSFAPSELSGGQEIDFFIDWMSHHFTTTGKESRNPLLFTSKPLGPYFEEIRKRRNTLKVMLQIPV